MKRPLAYITAAGVKQRPRKHETGGAVLPHGVMRRAFRLSARRSISPFSSSDAVPEEHKSGIDMGRDLLRRSHVLVVCGHTVTEA